MQSEVLGRELAALPVLPPSAVVDRQIRESIAKGRRRWSLGALIPVATGNGGGMRVALGALAILTLVSVFLLVRMAGDNNGGGGSIEAPSGGVAQQLESTSTAELAMLEETTVAGPTETARVVVPKTEEASSTGVGAQTQASRASNDHAAQVAPTQTLDSAFVYPIDKSTKTPTTSGIAPTQTPSAEGPVATRTQQNAQPTATEADGQVAAAAVQADAGTPVEVSPAASLSPAGEDGVSGGGFRQAAEASTTAEITIEATATATATPTADRTGARANHDAHAGRDFGRCHRGTAGDGDVSCHRSNRKAT